MRKIFFVISIFLVVVIVGFYAYLEFRIPEIHFVNDRVSTWADGKEMVLRRLYNSGVDIDKYFEEVVIEVIDILERHMKFCEWERNDPNMKGLAKHTECYAVKPKENSQYVRWCR